MCMNTGFSSARFNPTARLLGRDTYGKADPLIAGLESGERGFTKKHYIEAPPAPPVSQAQFESPNDPNRKRVSTLLGG